MGSSICVTGGAGFIGSHVAAALVAAGHRVLIVDDLSSGRKENVPKNSELHVLDVRSEEAGRLLVDRKVEILVHHAAQMDVRRSVADPLFDDLSENHYAVARFEPVARHAVDMATAPRRERHSR